MDFGAVVGFGDCANAGNTSFGGEPGDPRCGGRENYRALAAQERAEEQARRPNGCTMLWPKAWSGSGHPSDPRDEASWGWTSLPMRSRTSR